MEHVELYAWSLSIILQSSSIPSWKLHGSLLYHLWKRCLWFKKLQVDGDESLRMLQSTFCLWKQCMYHQTFHNYSKRQQLAFEMYILCCQGLAMNSGMQRLTFSSSLPLQIFSPRRLSKKTEWPLVLA